MSGVAYQATLTSIAQKEAIVKRLHYLVKCLRESVVSGIDGRTESLVSDTSYGVGIDVELYVATVSSKIPLSAMLEA